MDPGQNHFAVAAFCKPFHFLYHVLDRAAAHTSSGIRDDAIRTELIAAILHLDEGSGMFGSLIDQKILIILPILIDVHAVDDLFFHCSGICRFLGALCKTGWILGFKFCDTLHQMIFLVVADDDIHCQICQDFFCACLHIAACRHDNSVGILLFCPVDHLARLAVCHIRYRTGIDHIHICHICKGYDLISGMLQ